MSALNLQVVVGLGASGLSAVRFLRAYGFNVAVTDTRQEPPQLSELKRDFPEVPFALSGINETLLAKADRIILSPGISIKTPAIAKQLAASKPVIGDIELFAKAVDVPILGITGTNAKSTVTTLVGQMAKAQGLRVEVGGNLGTPALDLLREPKADVYVLELSSFQLETTYSLHAKVASVLNISPDHMDRYATLDDYLQAKKRIYQQCEVAVVNHDDPLTECHSTHRKYYFTLKKPGNNEFGLVTENNRTYLAFEDQCLLDCSELPISGKHYQANALAALAIGHAHGFEFAPMLAVLRSFKGLPHRCQLVLERQGVKWFNDSKGTNVGATIAAVQGLGSEIPGKIILIAGGLGKNADFSPLLSVIKNYVRHVVLIGAAAKELSTIIGNAVPFSFANDMQHAVVVASQKALADDCVLLSPACASYDMFKNFEHRGQVFMEAVQTL